MKFSIIDCINCGYGIDHVKKVSRVKYNNTYLQVVICKNCGLVFINPRLAEYLYADLYKNDYHNETSHDSSVAISIKEIINKQKTDYKIPTRLKNHINTNVNSILDIGAGMGGNIQLLGSYFNCEHLACIEAQDICEAHIKNTIKADLIAKDVMEEWQTNYFETFDIVVMRHVLEHLLDPVSVLEKINFVLKKNGIVYIAVPDMYDPKPPLKGYFFRNVHLYYFCQETLSSIILKAGFEPIELVSENHELWGVFCKTDQKSIRSISSVYHEQIDIIKKVMRQDIMNRIKRIPKKIINLLR